MELELANIEDIAYELSRRGLCGILAVDDLCMDREGSTETARGLCFFGHPVACLGIAHDAVRMAERDIDELYSGNDA